MLLREGFAGQRKEVDAMEQTAPPGGESQRSPTMTATAPDRLESGYVIYEEEIMVTTQGTA
jgi:hypothetical protein